MDGNIFSLTENAAWWPVLISENEYKTSSRSHRNSFCAQKESAGWLKILMSDKIIGAAKTVAQQETHQGVATERYSLLFEISEISRTGDINERSGLK